MSFVTKVKTLEKITCKVTTCEFNKDGKCETNPEFIPEVNQFGQVVFRCLTYKPRTAAPAKPG